MASEAEESFSKKNSKKGRETASGGITLFSGPNFSAQLPRYKKKHFSSFPRRNENDNTSSWRSEFFF